MVIYDNCLSKWLATHEWKQKPENEGCEPDFRPKRQKKDKAQTKNHKIVYLDAQKNEAFDTKHSKQMTGGAQHQGFSQDGIKQFLEHEKTCKAARAKKAGRAKEKEFVDILKESFGLTAKSAAEEKKKSTNSTEIVVNEEGDDGMGGLLGDGAEVDHEESSEDEDS